PAPGPGRHRPDEAAVAAGPAPGGSVVEQLDAGQPQARGVDLGRAGQHLLALPQAGEALGAGALDDALDEGGAPVVDGLGELEAEEALDEPVGLAGLDPPPAQRLGEHAVAGDELAADLV